MHRPLKIITRLKKARGHLAAVLAMFADNRSCVDFGQPLQAVGSAISKAKRELIHDHIEHCLDDGEDTHGSCVAMKELKLLVKYFKI